MSRQFVFISYQARNPKGFGSQAEARPEVKANGWPGPGYYDPEFQESKIYSTRGTTPGFTSSTKRSFPPIAPKTPGPTHYTPRYKKTRLNPTIKIRAKHDPNSCFANLDSNSQLPGPADYDVHFNAKRPNSANPCFKTSARRDLFSYPKGLPPRFDGRNLFISVN